MYKLLVILFLINLYALKNIYNINIYVMYAMLHACRDFERMLIDKRVGGHIWQKDFGAKIWGLQGMFLFT